jgi:Mn2+/Fe2+ NRAMP family transporter
MALFGNTRSRPVQSNLMLCAPIWAALSAGQMVMSGLLRVEVKGWARMAGTRLAALVPALTGVPCVPIVACRVSPLLHCESTALPICWLSCVTCRQLCICRTCMQAPLPAACPLQSRL